MTINLRYGRGFYFPGHDELSQILFSHLWPADEMHRYNGYFTEDDLKGFKTLAKAHGWTIKIGKCKESDWEDE